MTKLDIEIPKNIHRDLGRAIRDSINDVAQETKRQLQRQLPGRFTIRHRWTERQFRVSAAKSVRNPIAVVGHREKYLADQVVGANLTNTSVPSPGVRRNRRRVVGRKRWPRALLRRPRFAILDRKSAPHYMRSRMRSGDRVVIRRMGRRGRKIRRMWTLRTTQRVTRRFPYDDIAERTMRTRFMPIVKRNITRVLAMT